MESLIINLEENNSLKEPLRELTEVATWKVKERDALVIVKKFMWKIRITTSNDQKDVITTKRKHNDVTRIRTKKDPNQSFQKMATRGKKMKARAN